MSVVKSLLDLLYPPKCVFCHRLLEKKEHNVCAACARSLKVSDERYSAPQLDDEFLCWAPLHYEGLVRESLHRYKFSGNAFYCETYADIICSVLNHGELACDMVTWIPLSKRHLRQRGYDQAELLARAVAKRTGIPCCGTLKKIKNIRAQSSLKDLRERAENVKGVYRVRPDAVIHGKRILLIDDIVTTGSTISEASGTLISAGAAEVRAAAIAHR